MRLTVVVSSTEFQIRFFILWLGFQASVLFYKFSETDNWSLPSISQRLIKNSLQDSSMQTSTWEKQAEVPDVFCMDFLCCLEV